MAQAVRVAPRSPQPVVVSPIHHGQQQAVMSVTYQNFHVQRQQYQQMQQQAQANAANAANAEFQAKLAETQRQMELLEAKLSQAYQDGFEEQERLRAELEDTTNNDRRAEMEGEHSFAVPYTVCQVLLLVRHAHVGTSWGRTRSHCSCRLGTARIAAIEKQQLRLREEGLAPEKPAVWKVLIEEVLYIYDFATDLLLVSDLTYSAHALCPPAVNVAYARGVDVCRPWSSVSSTFAMSKPCFLCCQPVSCSWCTSCRCSLAPSSIAALASLSTCATLC